MGDLLAVTEGVKEDVGKGVRVIVNVGVDVGNFVRVGIRVGIGVVVGATNPMKSQLNSIGINAKKITIPFRENLMFIIS
jgi:hypothetical protein